MKIYKINYNTYDWFYVLPSIEIKHKYSYLWTISLSWLKWNYTFEINNFNYYQIMTREEFYEIIYQIDTEAHKFAENQNEYKSILENAYAIGAYNLLKKLYNR